VAKNVPDEFEDEDEDITADYEIVADQMLHLTPSVVRAFFLFGVVLAEFDHQIHTDQEVDQHQDPLDQQVDVRHRTLAPSHPSDYYTGYKGQGHHEEVESGASTEGALAQFFTIATFAELS